MGVKKKGAPPQPTDDDDALDTALDTHVKTILTEAQEDDGDDSEIVVDDDDDDEPGQTTTTRDAKKKSRWAEHTEARRVAEERNAQLERDLATERARVAAIEQRQPVAVPQGQETPDQYFARIEKGILEQKKTLRKQFDRLKDKATEEDTDLFQEQYEALDMRSKELAAQKVHFTATERARRDAPDPMAQATQNHVITNYPDLANNKNALRFATALLEQTVVERELTTGRAEAPNMQLLDEVLKKTRKRFFPNSPQNGGSTTSERTIRSRFSGPPKGPASGGGGNGGPRTVVMTPADKRMARTQYPKLDPDKAYKLWAKNTSAQED